jgi:uncharacterized phage protein (TIGR02218 family)
MLRVPSITDDAMKVRLPTVRAQRLCNHVLYDTQCRVDRSSFQFTTTIVSQSGATLVLSSAAGKPNQWATFGEVVLAATGERRNVLSQIGTTFTISLSFVGLVGGDTVTVFAGCNHNLFTCRDKFNNVINFGGMPHLNSTSNPWVPGGLGVIVQQ